MAIMGSVAALGPFIEYLRPAKSPYLLMILFGTVSLNLTALFFQVSDDWLMLAAPQFLALVVFSIFAYYGRDENPDENQEDQLKFARAVGISTAVMCLAVGSKSVEKAELLFNTNYFACILQLGVFSIYAATRLVREEQSSEFNFFQFSLVTSVFLIGATYAISQIKITDDSYTQIIIKNGDSSISKIDPFFVTSIVLYLLWSACQIFWIRRIISLINISVSKD